MNKNEEYLIQLKRIYRLRQLYGIIPFNMSFEEYIEIMKELYGVTSNAEEASNNELER